MFIRLKGKNGCLSGRFDRGWCAKNRIGPFCSLTGPRLCRLGEWASVIWRDRPNLAVKAHECGIKPDTKIDLQMLTGRNRSAKLPKFEQCLTNGAAAIHSLLQARIDKGAESRDIISNLFRLLGPRTFRVDRSRVVCLLKAVFRLSNGRD